jgi:hypothetical protein
VNASINWAVFVVVCAVVFSGACNLTAVLHRAKPGDPAHTVLHGDPGIWVGLMAVWPVIAFGLVAGLKATKPPHADTDDDPSMAYRLAETATALGDGLRNPKGGTAYTQSDRVRRTTSTAPTGGHMATTATGFPPVPAASNGESEQASVVVPVAAAWTRTGLTDGENDLSGHNGQHNGGHAFLPPVRPADSRPAPAPTPVPPPRQPLRDLPSAPTPPASAAPVLTPPVRERPAETTGPRLPAVQFRAPEPPAPAIESGDETAGEIDVSDLLQDAQKVRDALAKAGTPLNRRTLHAGLKERGKAAGTRKLDALIKELRPEPAGVAR